MITNSIRSSVGSALRAALALLFLLSLLPAVSMARAAAAGQVNANASTNASANTNGEVSAETAAQTEKLGTAVGGFWKMALQKTWPYIRGVVHNFFVQVGNVFKLVTKAFSQVDKSINVNANAQIPDVINVNGEYEVR